MSSALGINAHHHGTKPSGASRSHVIIASAGEPNVKVIIHRKQFKLSFVTHSLAVVVLLFHLTLFHIIVITSIKKKKKKDKSNTIKLAVAMNCHYMEKSCMKILRILQRKSLPVWNDVSK